MAGWKVFVDPVLIGSEPGSPDARSPQMLKAHLRILSAMLPAKKFKYLRMLGIWIEREHPTFKNMQYHPSGA